MGWVGGPCDFSVSPQSQLELLFGSALGLGLGLGGLGFGLGLDNVVAPPADWCKETHHHCFYEEITLCVYLGLTELRVLGHILQLQGLQSAHGDDGVVGEQSLRPPGPVHHPREVGHCKK